MEALITVQFWNCDDSLLPFHFTHRDSISLKAVILTPLLQMNAHEHLTSLFILYFIKSALMAHNYIWKQFLLPFYTLQVCCLFNGLGQINRGIFTKNTQLSSTMNRSLCLHRTSMCSLAFPQTFRKAPIQGQTNAQNGFSAVEDKTLAVLPQIVCCTTFFMLGLVYGLHFNTDELELLNHCNYYRSTNIMYFICLRHFISYNSFWEFDSKCAFFLIYAKYTETDITIKKTGIYIPLVNYIS